MTPEQQKNLRSNTLKRLGDIQKHLRNARKNILDEKYQQAEIELGQITFGFVRIHDIAFACKVLRENPQKPLEFEG